MRHGHEALISTGAGIDRSRVYVTNSVKHFKFWLQEEIQLVKPRPQLRAR